MPFYNLDYEQLNMVEPISISETEAIAKYQISKEVSTWTRESGYIYRNIVGELRIAIASWNPEKDTFYRIQAENFKQAKMVESLIQNGMTFEYKDLSFQVYLNSVDIKIEFDENDNPIYILEFGLYKNAFTTFINNTDLNGGLGYFEF